MNDLVNLCLFCLSFTNSTGKSELKNQQISSHFNLTSWLSVMIKHIFEQHTFLFFIAQSLFQNCHLTIVLYMFSSLGHFLELFIEMLLLKGCLVSQQELFVIRKQSLSCSRRSAKSFSGQLLKVINSSLLQNNTCIVKKETMKTLLGLAY